MSDGDWWESWLMLGLLLFLKKYMHFNLLCCKKSEIEQKSEVHLEKTCEIAVEQSFNEKWNRAVISVWGHQTSIISLLGSNITIRCAFFFPPGTEETFVFFVVWTVMCQREFPLTWSGRWSDVFGMCENEKNLNAGMQILKMTYFLPFHIDTPLKSIN